MKLPIKKYTLFRMINSKMQLNMTRMFSWGRRGIWTVGHWDSGTVSNYLKKKRKTGVHFTVTKELMQIPCLPKIIREIHLLVDFFG